jgi:hypothetical protein
MCIGVALTGFLLPFWFFCCAALCYILWKPGYELIVLGMCIDAQFGTPIFGVPCLYTGATALLVLVLNLVKPHLSFYR